MSIDRHIAFRQWMQTWPDGSPGAVSPMSLARTPQKLVSDSGARNQCHALDGVRRRHTPGRDWRYGATTLRPVSGLRVGSLIGRLHGRRLDRLPKCAKL